MTRCRRSLSAALVVVAVVAVVVAVVAVDTARAQAPSPASPSPPSPPAAPSPAPSPASPSPPSPQAAPTPASSSAPSPAPTASPTPSPTVAPPSPPTVAPTPAPAPNTTPLAQAAALRAFYTAAAGPSWQPARDGWQGTLFAGAHTDPCTTPTPSGWQDFDATTPLCVTPTPGDVWRVDTLDMSHTQMAGSLATELGALPALRVLLVYNNSLVGTLPPTIGALTMLERLSVAENSITGTLPVQWSTLTALRELFVDANDLSGVLPTTFGALTALERVHLSHNAFVSSTLPSAYGAWTALSELRAVGCSLGGSVPTQLDAAVASISAAGACALHDNAFVCAPAAVSAKCFDAQPAASRPLVCPPAQPSPAPVAVQTGNMAYLASAGTPYGAIDGAAVLAHRGVGMTGSLIVAGLPPAQTFAVHLHRKACADDDGGPHMQDPNACPVVGDANTCTTPQCPRNEMCLSGTTDADGRLVVEAEVAWTIPTPLRTGLSIVVHDSNGTKQICADLDGDETTTGALGYVRAVSPESTTLSLSSATMTRGADASSRVQLAVAGAQPNFSYPAHVHASPCAFVSGGPHYPLAVRCVGHEGDVAFGCGATAASEWWASATSDASGALAVDTTIARTARADAVSWVLHACLDGAGVPDPSGVCAGGKPRLACVDFDATVAVTDEPTPAPTAAPTASPTVAPTAPPTVAPTSPPAVAPTALPTVAPSPAPTAPPSPTATPSPAPTLDPTPAPTAPPIAPPSPTSSPTSAPTLAPTPPTVAPTPAPTSPPTPAQPTPRPAQVVVPTPRPPSPRDAADDFDEHDSATLPTYAIALIVIGGALLLALIIGVAIFVATATPASTTSAMKSNDEMNDFLLGPPERS